MVASATVINYTDQFRVVVVRSKSGLEPSCS